MRGASRCVAGLFFSLVHADPRTRHKNAQIRPLWGFNRLAAAGFSEDDIANFRRTFHSQSSGNYIDTQQLGEDEDSDRRRTRASVRRTRSFTDATAKMQLVHSACRKERIRMPKTALHIFFQRKATGICQFLCFFSRTAR
ncbi:hypothetical protein DFH11DRAFT_303829 [Phellopilus nigrolimitatus]|nr:hypothetical protein DFH11DRAFT_303829 [Phellopilus nigrolimitatus]